MSPGRVIACQKLAQKCQPRTKMSRSVSPEMWDVVACGGGDRKSPSPHGSRRSIVSFLCGPLPHQSRVGVRGNFRVGRNPVDCSDQGDSEELDFRRLADEPCSASEAGNNGYGSATLLLDRSSNEHLVNLGHLLLCTAI